MVDKTETTFNSSHYRMDEYVFSARRILSEGEKPKLEVVIENPRVGLLALTRKQWCWFSWDNGTDVVPLFFGRILGIPNDLQSETITVTFVAWPSDYKKQLQNVAEALKVPPFYDPIFIDVSKRDDPMTIFESQSKMVCVDPVTLAVSASDVLDAEDGNVDFTEDDHFYNSVHCSPGAVPKTAIYVDMLVSWTQTARGYVDLGDKTITTYTGDGIIGEWPQPLSNIADGLTVFSSLAYDVNNITNVVTSSFSGSWTNTATEHEDGDALSSSWSWTVPQIHSENTIDATMTFRQVIGVQDPLTVDEDGDLSPTNIPPSVDETHAYVPWWVIKTSLVVEYQAARQHTERVIFTLFAGVQPTTLDPLVTEDSETLSLTGSDVGIPIVDQKNWTTISGTHVLVGTFIFPNDPLLPGNNTAQVAVVEGDAGTGVEPNFSDVPGDTTVDGTVTWASLGVATPTENAPDWTGNSHVPLGTMILPRRPIFTTWDYLTLASRLVFPPQGASVSEGTVIRSNSGASYQVCTQSGTTNLTSEPAFSATWGTQTTDGTVTWTSLGSHIPSGTTYFIATTGGLTNYVSSSVHVVPPFNETLRSSTTDGTVVWTAVATAEIPVGGTPGNVTASDYFPRARGRQSLEHGICRARARLRYASRCVSTQFECAYSRGVELTLRKSVTLHDRRLPGGLITGKVTGTELVADGGSFTCAVTIGSAVGLADTISEAPGDPTYVTSGYVATGYQRYVDVVTLVPVASDVGYSPLVSVPDEDGIRFPLEKNMIVVSDDMRGADMEAQDAAVREGLKSMAAGMQLAMRPQIGGLLGDELRQREIALDQANGVAEQLKRNPSWQEYVFKPINGNGAFNHVYHLKVTKLALPKMIDLQEESTT
jgi:hypothetical protein